MRIREAPTLHLLGGKHLKLSGWVYSLRCHAGHLLLQDYSNRESLPTAPSANLPALLYNKGTIADSRAVL